MFINAKLMYSLIGLLLISIVVSGVQSYRLALEQRDHAKTIAGHERDLATLEKSSRIAAEDNLKLYQSRTEALQKEAKDANTKLLKAKTDHALAVNAGIKLRSRIATLTANTCTVAKSPATDDRGKTTQAALNLLDDVQRRLDEATDGIAQFADAAHIAGTACERSYDALNIGVKSWVIDEMPDYTNQALNRVINVNQSPNIQSVTN